ncbi:DUF2785 domain-containing protein [Nocardioides astragali]|uniref:DUF2785 domain-containing protein n=1 Tax=Nocardioides astragali TaxID=1776736 RepID=A0ABW2MXS2_9ACTN|nr:DUF2785 domain-containing protein [Nocardioides astragali]
MPADTEMTTLVGELEALLASPDPVKRDEWGYGFVATWLGRGLVPPELRLQLGDEMARRLESDDIWVRCFAPLVLDALVTYGTFEARWLEPFARWYASETDLRGSDPELGWLHAVAHGADLLGTLGHHLDVRPSDMLELAARRLTLPTDFLWGDGEDERLGHAIALTLTHPRLTETDAVGWIDAVATSWASREPGPPPAWVSNAARTLRMVVVLTWTGVRSDNLPTTPLRHAAAVRARLVSTLHTLTPHLW